jgi:hypothetical protein
MIQKYSKRIERSNKLFDAKGCKIMKNQSNKFFFGKALQNKGFFAVRSEGKKPSCVAPGFFIDDSLLKTVSLESLSC